MSSPKEDGLSTTTDTQPRQRRTLVLVAGLIAIVVWQSIFFRHGDPETSLASPYRLTASGGVLAYQQDFVYFLYYLNLYPLASLTTGSRDYSVDAARRLIADQGDTLVVDRYWTTRYGELGKTYLYLPSVWAKGRPIKPRMLHANAFAFTLALVVLFAGFWAVGRSVLGAFLVLLIGSNPFQVYEVYANNNVFGWPITITVLILGLHLPLMRDRPPRIATALLFALATGLILGTLRQIRTEPVLVAASAAAIYATASHLRYWVRLALVVLLAAVFLSTSAAWTTYFETKYREAATVVRMAGGHTYDGPRQSHHFLWHAIWCGLGDFDRKYGYQWSDLSAIRYAWPILQRRGFEVKGYPPVAPDPWDKLTLGAYWDKGGQYARTLFETPEYVEVTRDKVLRDVFGDPTWYASIVCRRVVRILTGSTPPTLALGDGRSFTLLSAPGQAIWGALTVAVAAWLLVVRDWFRLKLLLFTLPLDATALVVYSGGGTVYYSILHLVALAILAEGVWSRYRRERAGLLRASRDFGSSLVKVAGTVRQCVSLGWMSGVGLAIALLVVVLFNAVRHIPSDDRPSASGQPLRRHAPLVAVLRFDNQTQGEALAWVGDAIGDLLARTLARAGVRVLDPDTVAWLDPDLLFWGPTNRLISWGPGFANIVADRSGAEQVVVGRVFQRGQDLITCVEVRDPGARKRVLPERCGQTDPTRVFESADRLAQTVLTPLGVTVDSSSLVVPDRVESYRWFTEARRAARRQMWARALRLLDRSLRQDPQLATARLLRARVLSRWGRLDPDALRDLTGTSDRRAALDTLRAEASRNDSSIETRIDLGRMLLNLEMFGDAAAVVSPLLSIPGAPPEAFDLLARVRAARGDMAGGYQAAIEQQRRSWQEPQGMSLLAAHLIRWDHHEGVVKLLDEAATERVGRGMVTQTLDDLVARWTMRALQGDWTQAQQLASQMASVDDPRCGGASALYLARGFLFQGRSRLGAALAEEAARALGRQQMDTSEALDTAAEVRLEQGDAPAALRLIHEGLASGLGSADPRVAFWEALGLARLGRQVEGDHSRERLAKEAAGTPGPSVQRSLRHLDGELSLLRGDPPAAIRSLAEAARLLPARGFCGDHVPIWYALARAHVRAGDATRAVGFLERVTSATSERLCWPIEYTRSFFLLGRLQAAAGRMDDAEGAYRQFLNLWGEADLAFAERQEALKFLETRSEAEGAQGPPRAHEDRRGGGQAHAEETRPSNPGPQ